MLPEVHKEIEMCNECISHLLENAGPDHIIVKYRNALVELNVRGEEIERLGAERAVWIKHYQDNRKKHAALKKLGEMVRARGEALVEERAYKVGSMAAMSGRLMDCFEAEKIAREQLRAEKVIR